MKILVVHRQKETVETIKSVLSGCNPVVRQADSGLEGLLTSRIEHFDIIICGTDLPVITGFELVRSIRTHSVNRNTPVIFIADEVNEKTLHLGNALGVAGMLVHQEVDEKLLPIVTDKLKPVLTQWAEIIKNASLN
jgi:CheY-like chemotaxis protein